MIRKRLALIAAATLMTAQAPAELFDARDPAGLIALLARLEAKAEVASRSDDAVHLRVTTPAYGFNIDFAGCDRQGRACRAVAFHTISEGRRASLAEINGFNQTSITCRLYLDPAGKPHVQYAALVSRNDTPEETLTHIGAWQGCLSSFNEFLSDPTGYLASAP
jgi:Putative bacterial sensory transduction regulator